MTKLRWMLVTLVIPEYILGKSYSDRCSSRIHTKGLAQEDGVEWSVAHTFLANIGGFAFKFEEAQTTPSHSRRTGEQQSTLTAHSQDVSGQYISSSFGHGSNRLSGAYGPEAVESGHTIAANSTRALSDDPINRPTAPPSVSEVDVQTGASGLAAKGSKYTVRSGVMRDGSTVPAI
ncbi:hypothetical protein B0A48_06314 [Cryoendolithus antarcticus]|uniref:Uncharacterized protein n=1 Tax=Cryoendolithus antarcticus TaxID=1507870 RepID=A0A1V8TAZ3_9PEZI|nr:hypothetical protein B0A48_06314 [Cryoendolithus antarcticus]